ncbi:thiamine phosphate synthase [Rosenbergiella nectarea]|uniref:thiamine phosphate synthase n=1 Tax=Rosenbergiella nectarea TaxID=988801 RepID=UPI001F4EFD19|nr:thiamine phosphate synthase [Rosenbergiella nectarea]
MRFPEVPFVLGLYPVVDSVQWIERLLNVGVKTLQLRIKNANSDVIREEIRHAIALAKQFDARLFINDEWRLAIEYQAYGVHLGQEDLLEADLSAIAQAGLRLGVSTHSDEEIEKVLPINPSYIALGPVYTTQTKEMAMPPQGITKVAEHVAKLKTIPTVAIGGISLERAADVLQTGVGSIAVVSAITQATDWRAAVASFQQLIAEQR